jgi:hypothetical protein
MLGAEVVVMTEQVDDVVAEQDPFSAANEALVCELVMGDRRHGL